MRKTFLFSITFLICSALLVGCQSDNTKPDYNYISPEELKVRLDRGDITNGRMMMFTTQTEKEYASGYLEDAIPTYARPLETDADFSKLDPVLNQVRVTSEDIIIICPRGGSGATRPFDYFEENGIHPDRMLILTGGQEAYNRAFPDDVVVAN